MSIREQLAAVPSGAKLDALKWEEVGAWLRRKYAESEEDKARRERAKKRHRYYLGGGDSYMEHRIASIFSSREVLAKRREWVPQAKFNNVLRRIVNELATVYSVPAQRKVRRQADQKNYLEVQRLCRQHEMARRWNRWGMLHRNCAVGFRLRDDGTPVIDVRTPDTFWAVAHPVDWTRLIAIGFELGRDTPRIDPDAPRWVVWTDTETFLMSEAGRVFNTEEHGHERMPWVLLSMEPPAGMLLDDTTGEELVAAHESVWFENILLLKESKSATKIPVLAGDTTSMARQQAADTEMPVEIPDGATISQVDMSMDLTMFRETARNIYETAAANHGLPPNILMHQGVQSAEARELMRAPLKELRREQEIYFREFEREFAQVQAMVLQAERPELAFDVDGWTIDFGESRTPLDPKTAAEVFEHERRLGLTNTLEELMRRNPDLDPKSALEKLEANIEAETLRNELQRPLQAISGSASAPVGSPDAQSDADSNGRDEDGDAGLRAINGGQRT